MVRIRWREVCLVFFLLGFRFPVSGETYTEAMAELYFGRQPSARSEALGKCGAGLSQGVYASSDNPGLLSFESHSQLGLSKSSPYYELDDSRFTYVGALYKKPGYGTFGISSYYYHCYYPLTEVEDKQTAYTLSYAFLLFPDFSIGVNLNWMRDQVSSPITHRDVNAFPVDVGLVKTFADSQGQVPDWLKETQIGVSVLNVLASEIGDDQYKYPLPVVAKGGGSARLALSQLPDWLSVLMTAEYQHVLNSKVHRCYKFGSEITVSHWLSVRLGYYKESVDHYNNTLYRKYIEDVTYGLGVKIPFNQWTQSIPLEIQLDLVHLNQPSFNYFEPGAGDFTGVNVMFSWKR